MSKEGENLIWGSISCRADNPIPPIALPNMFGTYERTQSVPLKDSSLYQLQANMENTSENCENNIKLQSLFLKQSIRFLLFYVSVLLRFLIWILPGHTPLY